MMTKMSFLSWTIPLKQQQRLFLQHLLKQTRHPILFLSQGQSGHAVSCPNQSRSWHTLSSWEHVCGWVCFKRHDDCDIGQSLQWAVTRTQHPHAPSVNKTMHTHTLVRAMTVTFRREDTVILCVCVCVTGTNHTLADVFGRKSFIC